MHVGNLIYNVIWGFVILPAVTAHHDCYFVDPEKTLLTLVEQKIQNSNYNDTFCHGDASGETIALNSFNVKRKCYCTGNENHRPPSIKFDCSTHCLFNDVCQNNGTLLTKFNCLYNVSVNCTCQIPKVLGNLATKFYTGSRCEKIIMIRKCKEQESDAAICGLSAVTDKCLLAYKTKAYECDLPITQANEIMEPRVKCPVYSKSATTVLKSVTENNASKIFAPTRIVIVLLWFLFIKDLSKACS